MSEIPKEHTGLSYSSMSLFSSCARKYWLKKIARLPIDSDASSDSEPFAIGKAFHKVLEDTKHDLTGLKYDTVLASANYNGLGEEPVPMIFAMLASYKTVHEKSGLKAIACEVEIETKGFYGIVDAILEDPATQGFWICDNKTASSFSPSILPTLPSNAQLNLYAAHIRQLSAKLGLEVENFLGCRYRVTTKSKMIRKKDETTSGFISRLGGSVKTLDIVIPKEVMTVATVASAHAAIANYVYIHGDEERYLPNYGNCFSYFKPCEWFSKCHGHEYTADAIKLEILE